ncbi:MAG TPA: histidinol-phosphate transaminase [Gelria sp.]|jgi:histidinol-phosphate aminotransferase|nr:histidinol-phosphate transaminase [Gelria sp.]
MSEFIEKKARPEIFNLKPYVPGKPIEEVQRELGIDDIIKLASNENPLGPSPLGKKAFSEVVDKLHIYPDANCFNLKQKLSKLLDYEPQGLLIGNGSDELLKLLAETFLNPGDEIVFAQPSFAEYEFTATIMGAKSIKVPLIDFKHDLDAMLAAITPRTKIVYICNPNNPTGTIVTAAEIDSFMTRIPEDVLVVFDEAYYEYVEDAAYVSGIKYVKQGRNAVVLRTFSKIYGLAALRVGYGVTTPDIAAAVERVTEPFNVNTPAQVAAAAALDDKEHLKQSKKVNQAGKNYLYEEFQKLQLKYIATEANFIFVDTGKDSQEVFQELLKQGVIIRTGDIFGYPTYIRVTVGNEKENVRLIECLKKILGA